MSYNPNARGRKFTISIFIQGKKKKKRKWPTAYGDWLESSSIDNFVCCCPCSNGASTSNYTLFMFLASLAWLISIKDKLVTKKPNVAMNNEYTYTELEVKSPGTNIFYDNTTWCKVTRAMINGMEGMKKRKINEWRHTKTENRECHWWHFAQWNSLHGVSVVLYDRL